jgi:hypothetical protein
MRARIVADAHRAIEHAIGVPSPLVELHVGEVFDKPADHHQIWLDPSQVKLVEA